MDTHAGFSLFGRDHLAALAVVFVVGLLSVVIARRGGARLQRALSCLLAAALTASHATEYLVAWAQGWYTREMLPLQLCDVAALLAVWALLARDRRAIEPRYFFALSGTLPALVTPDLDVGFPHLRFVVFFAEHGLTVVAPVLLVIGLGHRPRPGAWRRAVLQLHVLAGVAALVNRALGTNFLFLSSKPEGPTTFDLFGSWPYYLLVLEGLVLVVFRLLQAVADTSIDASSARRARLQAAAQPRVTTGACLPTTRAGMPTAVAPAGTSESTTAWAPIRASAPMLIGPSSLAPAPTITRSPTIA